MVDYALHLAAVPGLIRAPTSGALPHVYMLMRLIINLAKS